MMHVFLRFPTRTFMEAFFFLLGAVNRQFYMFFRLCSSKVFFVSQRFSLIVFLKNKLKIFLKRTRDLLNKEKFLLGISVFRVFHIIL
jgi:hypothetical protein